MINSRHDLCALEAETDVVGDVDEWMRLYESGAMAIAYADLMEKAKMMVQEIRIG